MSHKAKVEFNTLNRHYYTGDDVLPEDVTMNVHELCLTTLEAERQKYKVTLKANGGTGADVVTQTEGHFQFPACTFTAPANKEFKNWALQSDGSGPKNVGDQINVVQNTDYYAIWKPVQVTIHFNSNGGSGSMSDVKHNKGEQYTLPACTFTAPDGKKFKAWSTQASGADPKNPSEKITINGETTLYPVWVQNSD